MEDYRKHLVEKGFSDHTIQSYEYAIRQLDERIGLHPTSTDLLAHKDWLAANYSAKTVNLRITAINSYLDFTEFEGIRLKGLRIQQEPYLDNVISQAGYEHMRDSLIQDGELFWHFVVRFLACTGARVSELRMFTVESVRAGHLDIVSKGQKLRRIYVPSRLAKDTAKWLRDIDRHEGHIFESAGKKPMPTRGIAMGLKRYARKYNIDPDVVYPHSFRHRFAKNFIAKCQDIAFLADLMGHESIETTRVYLRRTAAEQRAAVDAAIDW